MRRGLTTWVLPCALGGVLFGCSGEEDAHGTDAPHGVLDSCPTSTGYGGDELALCPPDPSIGLQLHYGPENYDDPEDVARFLIEPGEETEDCYYIKSPNTETVYTNRYHGRMRPGSHHLIVWKVDNDRPDGFGPCPSGTAAEFMVGSQEPVLDVPPPDYEGDEDLMVLRLEPNTQLALNMHYINYTPEPVLREAWVNFGTMIPTEDTKISSAIFLINANLNIGPNQTTIETMDCTTQVRREISSLTGHMHMRGVRFSIWALRGGVVDDLVFETYDWSEPGWLLYHDAFQNPLPDRDTGTTGGISGPLVLEPGDGLRVECEFENNSDRTYWFGDSAVDHEMCNAFGYYAPSTGTSWRCFNGSAF